MCYAARGRSNPGRTMHSSPDSVRRLYLCVLTLLSLVVLAGLWMWPVLEEHRWYGQAKDVREGSRIGDVLRRLGPASWKDEYTDIDGGDREDHYRWHRGDDTL